MRGTFYQAPPPPPPPPPRRDDHGDTARRATEIALTGQTSGWLHTREDVDYFTLTAPHAGVLVVETLGYIPSVGTVWQDDAELATADSGGTQRNFRLSTRVEAGPVVLAVRGNGQQTGRYVVQTAFVAGSLENPGPASFQSGIGVLSGWVCEAEGVEFEILAADGTVHHLAAAYGTERGDTHSTPAGEELCGDTDNGFGLLFNWNQLGDGEHEVVAVIDGVALGYLTTVDGIELGRATVTVTTLGEEFARGLVGECEVTDFPGPGESVRLVWQQPQQNFVLAGEGAPGGENRAGKAGVGYLENPAPHSFQSGVGVISGWVCEAADVEIEIIAADGTVHHQAAAYGTERLDTHSTPAGAEVCGDADNGFGLLFNWNQLGAGEHTVVALVDGEELGRATVTVTTLGEEFARGLVGECEVADFPGEGQTVTLEWQQPQQNFVITGGP